MDFNLAFSRLQNVVRKYQKFLLISHIYTDGDALGSMIALKHYLSRSGKTVQAVVPGDIPEQYEFLDVRKHINCLDEIQTLDFIEHAEVVFILDISALQRMDRWYEPVMQSPAIKICIDHHPEGCSGVDWQLINEERIATAEIIYEFFRATNVTLNKEMALALYTGILSDSGSFRFEGTSSFTLRMAADLTGYGIDPARVYRQVYENSTKAQLRFWGNVLCDLRSEGKIDWAVVTKDMLKQFGVRVQDMNGLVDIIRRDATADVFVMFVENEDGEIMVGLRSKDEFDVGEIARSFGGGGHFHAAGFSSKKSMDRVVRETLTAIKEKKKGI